MQRHALLFPGAARLQSVHLVPPVHLAPLLPPLSALCRCTVNHAIIGLRSRIMDGVTIQVGQAANPCLGGAGSRPMFGACLRLAGSNLRCIPAERGALLPSLPLPGAAGTAAAAAAPSACTHPCLLPGLSMCAQDAMVMGCDYYESDAQVGGASLCLFVMYC